MSANSRENLVDLWLVRDGRPGTCPQCGGRGEGLTECPNRACQKWGYRFLPEPWAEQAHQQGDIDSSRAIGTAVGEFVLLGFVGAGQFGRVFQAVDPRGRRVALKLLHSHAAGAAEEGAAGESALQREVAALKTLQDSNIVRYLADGLGEARPWLAMEYLEDCRSLESEMRTRQGTTGFAIAELRQILAGVCKGLTAAHTLGIVHRDIKPANILLTGRDPELVPKLVDFGLARFVGDGLRTRSLAGTPRYMAPEQLSGGSIGPWTDLYAAACLFAELLAGQRLLEGVPVDEIDRRKLQPGFDPLADLAGLSRAERAFLSKAVAYDPKARLDSAAALWNGLSQLLEARAQRSPTDAYWQSRASELERENDRLRLALASAQPASSTPAGPRSAYAATGLIVSGAVLLVGIVLLVVWSYQRPVIPAVTADTLPAAAPASAEGPAARAPAIPEAPEVAAKPASPALPAAEPVAAPATPLPPARPTPRPRAAEPEKPRDLRWLARPDQTVADTATGLTWQAAGSPYSLNWAEAHGYCRNLRLAGRTDWRLPSRAELTALIDPARPQGQRIRIHFSNASSWYWTATPTGAANFAWAIDFSLGDAVGHLLQAGNRVRCVAGP